MTLATPTHPPSNTVAIIGAASCLGARDQRCDFGPQQVQHELEKKLRAVNIAAHWYGTLHPDAGLSASHDAYAQVAELCSRLALQIITAVGAHQRFVVIGGDHSCAIGTWSGAAVSRRPQGAIGLIWIDAHMDSHTPQSSNSGALHGMPLACLLGHGDDRLLHVGDDTPKLSPQFICVIGVRSYEPEEATLLNHLGVRVFTMHDIRRNGMTKIFQSALALVRAAPGGYGISIDLDAIDPVDAPGVGSPEPGGIPAQQLLDSLSLARHDMRLLGIEVAELNPFRDRANKTATLTVDLLSAVL